MSLTEILSFRSPIGLAISFLELARQGSLQYPTAMWDHFVWYHAIHYNEPVVQHHYADGRKRLEMQFNFICNGSIVGMVWLEGLQPAGGDDTSIAWAVSAFSYAPTWDGESIVDTDEHYGGSLPPRDHAVL